MVILVHKNTLKFKLIKQKKPIYLGYVVEEIVDK